MHWIQWVRQVPFSFLHELQESLHPVSCLRGAAVLLRTWKSSHLPNAWFDILESLNLTSWHNCKIELMCSTMTVNGHLSLLLDNGFTSRPSPCHVWTAIITLTSQICKRQTPSFQTTYDSICNHLPSYPLDRHKISEHFFDTIVKDVVKAYRKLLLICNVNYLICNDREKLGAVYPDSKPGDSNDCTFEVISN